MSPRPLWLVLCGLALFVVPRSTEAQQPRATDVVTPAAIVRATYDAINRRPGQPSDWARFRSLFLPGARLIPNVEQTEGRFTPMTLDRFIEWVDRIEGVSASDDPGFAEEEISHRVERFGAIAHVFSTYQKRYWGAEEILGRGINTFQLVQHEDRWWIAGIAWDEAAPGRPIPTRYLP